MADDAKTNGKNEPFLEPSPDDEECESCPFYDECFVNGVFVGPCIDWMDGEENEKTQDHILDGNRADDA
jgi:hypothetical protein